MAEFRAAAASGCKVRRRCCSASDDVHVVNDGGAGVLPAPVSAVISTRIKPGQETAYRAWELRIAAAQSKAPGFQGYRFEPPVPGVQEDWLAIVRFDTEANLQAWLDSPERHKLLQEAGGFTEEFHARIARTGFDQWFPGAAGGAPPRRRLEAEHARSADALSRGLPVRAHRADAAAYPRLGPAVRDRALHRQRRERLLLSYLVPWTSTRFSWWLRPAGPNPARTDAAGAALVVALYAVMLVAFWRLS